MPRRRKTVALIVLLLVLIMGGGLFALGRLGLPEFALDPQTGDGVEQTTSTATSQEKAAGEKNAAAAEKSDAGEIDDVAKALSKPEAPGNPDKPSFDIARISPDGTSVFAGQAKPNSVVSLLEDGRPVATAKADENGEWSMTTEHRFTSADPKLGLEARQQTDAERSHGEVAAATPTLPRTPRQTTPDQPEKERGEARAGTTTPTPNAIAEGMIRNLEGLVADARKEAEQPSGQDKPATAPAEKREADAQEEPRRSGPAVSEPSPSSRANAEADTPAAANDRTAEHDERAAGTESRSADNTKEPAAANNQSAESGSQGTKTEESRSATANAEPEGTEGRSTDTEENQPATTNRMAAASPAPSPRQATIPIPVPIMFVYREATFTEQGERAASLLLEYLKLKKFDEVSLSGHADERGSVELNYELSEDRLETVEKFLRDGGFTGKLNLVPKGKLEPYTGVDRSKYDQEALYQLDRRVELHVTQ